MAATATDCGGVAESLFMRSSPASFRAPRPRAASGKAGRQNMAVRRPRLAAARQHAGWRCCCRLETLPACSISSTRAARRAASRAPTGFGQADAARARSVGSVTRDSLATKGSFCRVLALLCVDKFPILSRATRATCTCTCAFSLSVCSTIRPVYGLCTSLLGQSMPNPRFASASSASTRACAAPSFAAVVCASSVSF